MYGCASWSACMKEEESRVRGEGNVTCSNRPDSRRGRTNLNVGPGRDTRMTRRVVCLKVSPLGKRGNAVRERKKESKTVPSLLLDLQSDE